MIHTKRVFPYAVGRIDGGGSDGWTDPENALNQSEAELAFKHYLPDTSTAYAYNAYTMPSLDIPTFATIQAIRWVTRARFNSPIEDQQGILLLYGFAISVDGQRQNHDISTANYYGNSFAVVSTEVESHSFRMRETLNANRGAWSSPWDITARMGLQTSNPRTEEQTFFCDWLALEFDYTLPEFPLSMDLRIEE